MRYLLIALMVLAASPAQSDVICGKDWITFTATYTFLKSECPSEKLLNHMSRM